MDRQRKKNQLVDAAQFQNILAIKTVKASLVFTKNTIVTEKNKTKVDKKKVREFYQKLTSLRVKRSLERPEVEKLGLEHFFNDFSQRIHLQFKENSLDLVLGKKLEFDRTFYMKITKNRKERYAIVKDIAPRQGLYFKENAHRTSFAYLSLKEMMNRDDTFFTLL